MSDKNFIEELGEDRLPYHQRAKRVTDLMDLSGKVYASWHPPGVAYPSDSNEVSPGTYLTVDYSQPGQIETFDALPALP